MLAFELEYGLESTNYTTPQCQFDGLTYFEIIISKTLSSLPDVKNTQLSGRNAFTSGQLPTAKKPT